MLPDHPALKGASGTVLLVDLDSRAVAFERVPDSMRERFIGGRGLGLWLLWRSTAPSTSWSDPDNALVFSPGPLAGASQVSGAGKAAVVTLSPATALPIDSSVGGHLGPLLLACGVDALAIRGKAPGKRMVIVDGLDRRVRIFDADGLPADTPALAEHVARRWAGKSPPAEMSVVSAGRAASHASMACLNVSHFDRRRREFRHRQAGRGGIGRVFRDKGLVAVVVIARPAPLAGAAEPGRVVSIGRAIGSEIREQDPQQHDVRRKGTLHMLEAMAAYDVLPVRNFQDGSHADAARLSPAGFERWRGPGQAEACSAGCQLACAKAAVGHVVKTGPHAGRCVSVDGPEYSTCAALGPNCGIFDPAWVVEANYYCDTYGIDTISFGAVCAFAMECWARGVLDARRTGGLALEWGSGEAQLALLHRLADGEGFGRLAGQGVRAMQVAFAANGWGDPGLLADIGMQLKGLEYSPYVCRESVAQQAGYALANKGPHHDEAWLIFLDMINQPGASPDAIAEWLHYYPMFRTWFSLVGLCRLPWNDVEPADNGHWGQDAPKVPDHVRAYCALFEALTGHALTPDGLIEQSERVYTFQRLFNRRMGGGTIRDDVPPYRAIGPVTADEYRTRSDRYDWQIRETAGLDPGTLTMEDKLAWHRAWRVRRLQDVTAAAYRRRGWNADGVPTIATLQRLGLTEPELLALADGGSQA
jgi:aldehyde:ferredoxin oxidoreductase